MKTNTRAYLYICFSGLLAGAVYAFGLPWNLLPIAFSLFFWNLLNRNSPKGLKKILKQTGLFFIVFYGVVLGWFLSVDITLLAGLDLSQAPFILGLCLIIMALVLTVASLPIGIVLYRLQARLKQPDVSALLILASSWVVIEWLRSIVFSLFLIAPEASIGDYWNFGSLGMGVISSPFGYMSRFVGLYGLSFFVICLSFTILWTLKKRYWPMIAILAVMSVGSLLSYQIWSNSSGETFEGRLLQRESQLGDLPGSLPIREKSDTPKSLIVLPEYSNLYTEMHKNFTEQHVISQLTEDGIVLDVTADFESPNPRNSFLLAKDKTGIVDSQTKRLLIPTGEYLPSILKIFYSITGQAELIDDFAITRKLEKGDLPHVVRTNKFTIAPVACSGILSRNTYRQLVNDGGNVLTNSAALDTFGGSKSYFVQSLQMARFHAIANNRTFIQATAGAPGFVIDGNGRFVIEPDGTATEFADFQFTTNSEKTFYTKHGDWPLVLSGIFVVLYIVTSLAKKNKHRRNT